MSKKLMTVWIKVDANDDDANALLLVETRIRAAIDEAADRMMARDIAIDVDAVQIEDDSNRRRRRRQG